MKTLSLALPFALVLACSSNPPAAEISSEEACIAYTKTTCEKQQECSATELATTFGDLPTCLARTKLLCLAQVSAAATSVRPSGLAACAKDQKATTCAEVLRGKSAKTCATIPGTLGDAEACNFDAQCTSTFCKQVPGTGCGKCTKRQSVGAQCSTNSECETGSVCASGKCVIPAVMLEACGLEKPCEGALRCIDKVCTQPLTLDQDCKDKGEVCVPGAYCDGASFKCKAIGFAQANEACGTIQGKRVDCKASGFCPTIQGGTCKAAAADEAGCSDLEGPRCVLPASCIAGFCKLPQQAACRK
jgi:hypothetical protein